MSESIRVNLTVSPEVHAYLEARAALTGSTVAGSANDVVVAAMINECDRILAALPSLPKSSKKKQHDTTPND